MVWASVFIFTVIVSLVWVTFKSMNSDPHPAQADIHDESIVPAQQEEKLDLSEPRVPANAVFSRKRPIVIEIQFGQVFWPVFCALLAVGVVSAVLLAIVRAIN